MKSETQSFYSLAVVSFELLMLKDRNAVAPLLKHTIGVLWVILGFWGAGFIYTAATAAWAAWWDQGIMGILCLFGMVILFRIWNRAMENGS